MTRALEPGRIPMENGRSSPSTILISLTLYSAKAVVERKKVEYKNGIKTNLGDLKVVLLKTIGFISPFYPIQSGHVFQSD